MSHGYPNFPNLILLHVIFAVCFALVLPASIYAGVCGAFHFDSNTEQAITNSHRNALLHIKDGTSEGNGFLIDHSNGYVLTAAHVVANAYEKDLPVIGFSDRHPKRELKLKVLQRMPKPIDVALLQLDPDTELKDVTPFEMATLVPERNSKATMYGYPIFPDDANNRTKRGPALPETGTITGIQDNQFLMKVNTFDGDSGSAIFDNKGLAIGITTDRVGHGISVITPTISILQELIIPYSLTKNSKLIYDQILRGISADGLEDLKRKLDPKSGQGISNLDLVGAMKRLNGEENLPDNVRYLVHCPLKTASDHRGLTEAAAILISHQMPQILVEDAGRLNMKSASSFASIENVDQARKQLLLAESQLVLAAEQYGKRNPDAVHALTCSWEKLNSQTAKSLGLISIRSESQQSQSDVCPSGKYDNYLAAIYRDLSITRLRLSYLQLKDSSITTVQRAATEAATAAALLSPDGILYATNVELLGDIAHSSKDHKTAKLAYASAYQNGKQTSLIKNNYDYVAQLIEPKSVTMAQMLNIKQAKALNRTDLGEMISQ